MLFVGLLVVLWDHQNKCVIYAFIVIVYYTKINVYLIISMNYLECLPVLDIFLQNFTLPNVLFETKSSPFSVMDTNFYGQGKE